MNFTALSLFVLMLCGGYWGYNQYALVADQVSKLRSADAEAAESTKAKLAQELTRSTLLSASLKDASKTIELLRAVSPILPTRLTNFSEPVQLPGTMVTLDGKTYAQCVLIKVEPDGVDFSHSTGVAKIAFTDLDPSFAKAFSYDPVAGEEFEAQQEYHDASSDAAVAKASDAYQAKLEAEAAATPPPTNTVQELPPTTVGSWSAHPQADYPSSHAVYGGGLSSSQGYVGGTQIIAGKKPTGQQAGTGAVMPQ